MNDDYEKLPYIGKKRAKKLREAGIGIVEIAKMDEVELKKHLPRLSKGKIKVIIATARKIAGTMNDIMASLGVDEEKAKTLAFHSYDLQRISKAKKEELAKLLNIDEKEAFDLIFKASLKTGVKKPEVKIKEEEINHTGIISKEGFINGFGITHTALGEEISYRFVPILIVVLLIVAGLAAVVYYSSPSLKIDGDFREWSSVPGYALGNITYKYIYRAGSLYFYVHSADMFSREESYYVFIDDCTRPGYYVDGIHAHYVVEFYGWNNSLKGATLWKYVSNGELWNFTQTTGLRYSTGPGGIEFLLNEINPKSKIVFESKGFDVLKSAPLSVNFPTAQVLVSTLADVAKDNKPVLQINVSSPVKFNLDSLTVNYQGATILSAGLIIGNRSITGMTYNNSVKFPINLEISKLNMKFEANYSGNSGDVISFNVSLHSKDVNFSYVFETSKLYLFSPPSNVHIDGAFGDWKNRIPDSIMDVSDSNIDLVNYSTTQNLKDVFFEVRGEFMGGDDVPIVRKWAPKDSDRDGVPDKYDLFPHDFNNDGVPDSKSNGDVDGDGYVDYPNGNDTWLNTTIPADFPAPYAGKKVSVYIGPAPPVKPKSGNDTAEIYFGDNGGSGEHLSWVPFPVKYKIVIDGRGGLYNASLYSFFDGSWKFVSTVDAIASGYHAVELSTGLNLPSGRVWITVFNWNHEYDSISLHSRATRATTTNVFYLHADTNNDPGNMNWTEGSNKNTLKLITPSSGGKDYGEWYYDYTLTQDYYVLDAQVSFYISDLKVAFTSKAQDYLNITLVASRGSQNVVIAYGNASWQDLNNYVDDVYVMNLNVVNNPIPRGYDMVLNFTWITDWWGGGDELDIDYDDASPVDSNLAIDTNSTMQIVDVWSANDTTRDAQGNFHKGEIVGIYANVTDPLGSEHISRAGVSVVDSLGNTILSGSSMYQDDVGDGYILFYFSFPLNGAPYVYTGKYPITVTAEDKEGFSTSNNNGQFWVNSQFRTPVSHRLFVPPTTYSAQFRHRWDNHGGGDDILNFDVEATPQNEMLFYLDVNLNKIVDSSDVLYAKYDPSNGWVYMRNDTDGNGVPDITVMYGSSLRIIEEENVSLSSSHTEEFLSVKYYSFTGNFSVNLYDEAILRNPASKTLYLRGPPSADHANMKLYPQEGTTDEIYAGADLNGLGLWSQSISFANDLTITGYIVVNIFVDRKGAQTGHISLKMDDGTLIDEVSISLNYNGVHEYYALLHPQISMIPQGHRVYLTFYGDKKCDVYYNSSNYPSSILIPTTSYIYVHDAATYNIYDSPDTEFAAGDTVRVRATVHDPFGAYDISSVTMNVTAPDGSYSVHSMWLESDHTSRGYWIYRSDFVLPSDAYVGEYQIEITAEESNGVTNVTYVYFNVKCNISIDPHQNSSTGQIVWYYHTIWNNGSGTDIVTVHVSSDQNVNITLYVYDSGSWNLVAYSDTGTGWNWVDSSYDVDGDVNPDFVVSEGDSVRIKLRVDATSVTKSVNTTVNIDDSILSSCSDSATDETTVPELSQGLFALFMIPLVVLFRRRRKK